MKKYATYKDPGIEWIGSIPEHWECSKGRYHLAFLSGYAFDSNNFSTDEGMPLIRIRDIDRENTETKYWGEYPISHVVVNGDLLVGMDGDFNIALWKGDNALLNQRVCKFIETNEFNKKYAFYMLRFPLKVINELTPSATVKHLSVEDIYNTFIPVPPLAEQEAIVAYLDDKVGKIDSSVAAINSQIDDLKAYRQSVISEIVTKGLNPNASMKDSGIQWIGTIPEHWETRRIKMLSPVKRGASPRPIDDPKYFDENGQYSWVRIADVSSSSKYLYTTSQRLSELGARLSVKQHPGDIFISIAGSVGKPIITKIDCCIHDGFVWFPNLEYNKELLYYIFESGRPYLGLGKTGTQLNLNTDSIGNIRIPVPPLAEQEAIAKYLDEKTSLIDKVIKELEAQRDDLNTLKQSIISEAVTGKIDVRDWKKA